MSNDEFSQLIRDRYGMNFTLISTYKDRIRLKLSVAASIFILVSVSTLHMSLLWAVFSITFVILVPHLIWDIVPRRWFYQVRGGFLTFAPGGLCQETVLVREVTRDFGSVHAFIRKADAAVFQTKRRIDLGVLRRYT